MVLLTTPRFMLQWKSKGDTGPRQDIPTRPIAILWAMILARVARSKYGVYSLECRTTFELWVLHQLAALICQSDLLEIRDFDEPKPLICAIET